MTDIIRKFYYGQRWNAFESIFYKAVLLVHQTCLFYFATRLVYGFSSLLFALIYLAVELINLGFDHSCAQLSVNYFNSKTNFKYYFLPQLIIQFMILGIFLITLASNYQLINLTLLPVNAFLTKNQWCLLGVIIICESIRKTLRLIAQLLFLNKLAALLESSLILIYVCLFWTAIFYGYQINIYTIYIPLLIQSIVGVVGLLYFITPRLKYELQIHEINNKKITCLEIFYIRLKNYLYQLSELLFSSNFLIYFLSLTTSLIVIGPIKLANYLAVFIKALLERTFGFTSLAIFVRNKHLINDQKKLFFNTQRTLNFILITILLIVSVSFLIISQFSPNAYPALLFFSFTLINNFLIIYEQLFLVYNRILTLFLLNLGSIMLCLGFIYYNPQASADILIIWFIVCRSALLLIVKIITGRFFKYYS